MSGSEEIRHIHAYNGLFCESPPGEYPMMVPKDGTNCPECKRRDTEFEIKMQAWKKKECARVEKLEAQWAEEDKASKKKGKAS